MANARNRPRRKGRRRPFLEPKPTILVVTEGEVTEPEYLRGLQKAYRNPRVTVRVAEEHGVPKTLVRIAKQYKEAAEAGAALEKDENLVYDSVWCVFDIDEHPDVAGVKEMARDNGIELAISNPCVELWLVLHFRDNPGMQDRTTMVRRLKEHVPAYDKHIDYAAYEPGYSQAVKRAGRLDRDAEAAREPHRNPTTGVYRLTELIRGVTICLALVAGMLLASTPAVAAEATRVDGYRGIWFTLGEFSKHGDKYSGGLGTYTANHEPMAVYAPQVDKTFFTYGGTIPGQRHLLIMVSYFDHKTGTVPRPVLVYDKQGVDDPHDNACLNIDETGHLWVFISGRAKKRPGLRYRSLKPWSIDAFERVAQEEMTYPQAWFVPGQGWFLLFTKYTKGRELYWKTSPDGRTWTADRKLAGMGGHYQTSGARGTKIATFFNYHPGGVVNRRTNLYYAQTTDVGKTWTTVDGRPLTLPLADKHCDALVIDYEAQHKLMYTCDLNFDADGNPVLLYVTSRGAEPGPENDPREFCVTRWDGRAWQTHPVAKTDHNYDMGSLWTAGKPWTLIAPTDPGPQPYGGGGEMYLWTSGDLGRTWLCQRQITHASPLNHNYARRVLGGHDPFVAFWADGDPTKFSESRLYFCDSTGQHVWQLPYDMDGPTAKPKLISPASAR